MRPTVTTALLLAASFGCAPRTELVTADMGTPWLDPDRPLICVGPRTITRGEVYRRVMRRFGTKEILSGIAGEELFRLAAEERRVAVTAEDVEAAARERLAAWKERFADPRELAEKLQLGGLTEADLVETFAEEARSELLVAKVVALYRPRDEKALRDYYRETYAQNRALVGRLAFPVTGGREAARQAAETVRRRLLAGEPWSAVVHDCVRPDGAPRALGGDRAWISDTADVPAALKEIVFSLAAGEVSEPVWEEEFGYHVYYVEKKIPAEPFAACLEKLAEEIRTRPPADAETRTVLADLQQRYPVTLLEDASVPAEEEAAARAEAERGRPSPSSGRSAPR